MKFELFKGMSKKPLPPVWQSKEISILEVEAASRSAVNVKVEKSALLFCFQLKGRTILGKKILRPQEFTIMNSTLTKLRTSNNSNRIFIAISQKRLKEWKLSPSFFSDLEQRECFLDVNLFSDLNALLNNGFEGESKALFVNGKLLQVLARVITIGTQPRKRKHIRSEYDLERILFARDYLFQNIASPPGIPQLARIAGINELKLKMGFKEIFDNTVYGYLSDIRLEKAKQEVGGTRSLTEIAFELGYSSNQHFSMAFRKKFGMAPSSLRK